MLVVGLVVVLVGGGTTAWWFTSGGSEEAAKPATEPVLDLVLTSEVAWKVPGPSTDVEAHPWEPVVGRPRDPRGPGADHGSVQVVRGEEVGDRTTRAAGRWNVLRHEQQRGEGARGRQLRR